MIRPAIPSEFETIYLFGFDVWGDGQPMDSYLEGCRNSEKYKKGQWWVIENPGNQIVCALISYNLGNRVVGIGSLCTPLELRQRGHASLLLKEYLEHLDRLGIETVFLWSDIKPE